MKGTLLVLGASSDIGIDYLRRYADRYEIIAAQYHTNDRELLKLKEEIGEKICLFQADLTKEAEVDALISDMKEKQMEPDYILHLPARKTVLKRIKETDLGDLRKDFELQVVSVMNIIRNFSDHMEKEQFGRICFMLSSVTYQAVTFNLSYIVSKYALLGAVKALAAEFAAKKIMVNAVSPTMIDTKFLDDKPDMVKQKMISMVPVKRLANEYDVTRAIAFLLSDENEYITGDNILIGGGST